MSTVADALVILARAALALILALGLVALAVYAAGAQLGHLASRRNLGADRLKAEGGDRVHETAQR